MWGYISTEASYQSNFNVGFSTTRSDVLIHLAQWQYWWWFWFALVWSFYYLIVIKVIRFRVLKMRPKIVTSYRPHGKWGDFLACIIPMIWCLNILANSNFILRLIEWQNESSLFTVRVRARQWYWIYKFELKNFTDILTSPKNIGNNKWVVNTFGDIQTADDYLHILQLRSQNKWVKKYWSDILKKTGKSKKYHLVSPQDQFLSSLHTDWESIVQTEKKLNTKTQLFISNKDLLTNNFSSSNGLNNYYGSFLSFNKGLNVIESDSLEQVTLFNSILTSNLNFFNKALYVNKIKQNYINWDNLSLYFNNTKQLRLINSNKLNIDLVESTRWAKRSHGLKTPIRLIKYPLNLINSASTENNSTIELFRFRYNIEESKIQHKNLPNTPYLTLKQKRYKKKKIIPSRIKYYSDGEGNKTRRIRYSGKPILIDNKIFSDNLEDPTIQYRMLKKNKIRHDLIPVTLARRILRTKKTLVLPAHVNITLITNSYDIVHSWFVPGLGIKLDCVPGRSTHHTFFIDNVGFYYGQCAEICGRYHHHMPIRVCALPFEHFLVWWHTFGLPKLIATNSQKRFEQYYSFRKYVW